MDAETRQILVVDDEEAVCGLIKGALEARGYKVEIAHNSAEAMKKLTAGHYDMAILDYLMPKGDGKFLYQQLEAMHPDLARRVLVITGAPFEPRLIQFLSSANLRFLKKPFRIDELVEAVETLM